MTVFALGLSLSHAKPFASPPLKINVPKNDSFIIFVDYTNGDDGYVESVILCTGAKGAHTLEVDRFEEEGGRPPIIETVLTEDANGDGVKDLIILVRWSIEKQALQTIGSSYEVRVYDGGSGLSGSVKLLRDDSAESRFPSGFHGMREGKKVKYQYRTATDIRKALKLK